MYKSFQKKSDRPKNEERWTNWNGVKRMEVTVLQSMNFQRVWISHKRNIKRLLYVSVFCIKYFRFNYLAQGIETKTGNFETSVIDWICRSRASEPFFSHSITMYLQLLLYCVYIWSWCVYCILVSVVWLQHLHYAVMANGLLTENNRKTTKPLCLSWMRDKMKI